MNTAACADTLDAVTAYLRRYVVLPAEAADFLALWTAHTWAFEAAETTPYLRVVSPERQCGKTRLFESLEELCHRAWHTIDVTAAVLYRVMPGRLVIRRLRSAGVSGATADVLKAAWSRDARCYRRRVAEPVPRHPRGQEQHHASRPDDLGAE